MKYIYPTLGIILFMVALSLNIFAAKLLMQYPFILAILCIFVAFCCIELAIKCFKQ